MTPAGLPILTYHAIDGGGDVLATDPAWFSATMAALHGAGYRTVDLHDWVARGRPAVERGFALTFDDGLRSIRQAAEILSQFDFGATAFLITDRMGGENAWPGQPRAILRRGLLDWSDLASLRAAGVRFAAHTRTHPRLDRCEDRQRIEELRGSRDAIEQRLGEPCRLLAYPYGAASSRVREVARDHFDAAFGTRLDVARPEEDAFDISRIDAYYLRSPRVREALISGDWAGWLRRRRALRGVRRALVAG
jgi:peptidoglycan/xylan/chitin deacetylase (PgdA/CDA1 family)